MNKWARISSEEMRNDKSSDGERELFKLDPHIVALDGIVYTSEDEEELTGEAETQSYFLVNRSNGLVIEISLALSYELLSAYCLAEKDYEYLRLRIELIMKGAKKTTTNVSDIEIQGL